MSARPSVIYESIRTEGQHQLSRTFGALWWSGVAAGLAISISVLSLNNRPTRHAT